MPLSLFDLLSLVLSLVAVIAYINNRYFRLPTTTAIMVGSLFLSLVLLVLGKLGLATLEQQVYQNVSSFDFHHFLIQIVLSFMLFAGALNIQVQELWRVKAEITVLATLSTIASTLIIAAMLYYTLSWLGYQLDMVYCLLFGALISPTDPIAVLALFKVLGADKRLEVMVSGESLFNDGVGIVLFITFYQLAFKGLEPNYTSIIRLFSSEFFGGIFLGLLLGALGYFLIKPLNNIKVELLITLAIVTGGYSLASSLDFSGPLAMVAAGIVIGMLHTPKRQTLYDFWEMVDDILNSILFFLIGLELVVISHNTWSISLCLSAIIIVLTARWFTVAFPMALFKQFRRYPLKLPTKINASLHCFSF